MGKYILLLPVLALVLVSGCISIGGPSATGAGVVIDTFEPDFSSVLSTEKFQLQVKLTNRGSVPASDIRAEVLNADEFKPSGECREGSLLAPDPVRGTSGGVKTCLFSVEAPELAKGLSNTYTPILRLKYNYETNVIKSLTLLPMADARRLETQGGALPAETVSSSSSPVSFTITTKGPIRVISNSLKIPIEVEVRNTGGGTVCASSCDNPDNWNKFTSINMAGLSGLSGCVSSDLQLFKGQSTTISCEVDVDVPKNQMQEQITINAKYDYMVEQPTTIKVEGI